MRLYGLLFRYPNRKQLPWVFHKFIEEELSTVDPVNDLSALSTASCYRVVYPRSQKKKLFPSIGLSKTEAFSHIHARLILECFSLTDSFCASHFIIAVDDWTGYFLSPYCACLPMVSRPLGWFSAVDY